MIRLVLCLLAGLALNGCGGKVRTTHLDYGNDYFDSGDFEDARRHYRLAWQEREDLNALFNLGLVHLKTEDYREAEDTYQTYLARRPEDWQAHVNLGHALAGNGRNTDAEVHFEKAIALNETWPEPYCAYASHLLDRGNDEAVARARALMDAALEVAPKSAVAHGLRGLTAVHTGDLERAREDLNTSLRLNADNPRALLALAELEREAGNCQAALMRFIRLTVLTPDDPRGFIGAGLCRRERGLYEDALVDLWRARELMGPDESLEREILITKIGALKAQLDKMELDEAQHKELEDLLKQLSSN